MAELLDYIKKNVEKQSYSDLPLSLLGDETDDYGELDQILQEKVGKPIVSVARLRTALRLSDEPRSIAIRALMGRLDKSIIHKEALSCAARAVEVYAAARCTMDPKLLLSWIDGGGRGTKRPMTDNIQKSKTSRWK